MDHRVGRDGKKRPVRASDVRDRIERALEENPDSSLRAIALAAGGASPETVRRVRALRRAGTGEVVRLAEAPPCHEGGWEGDHALTSTEDCSRFVRWFTSTDVDDEWHRYVWTIPIGRAYEIVDEARRRAACWTAFASMLETRTRP